MITYTPRFILQVGERDGPWRRSRCSNTATTSARTGGAAHPAVEDVRRRMGQTVRFVCRHFPLTGIHPQGQPAAEAAEAAGVQGRFWAMHDRLFEHQDALDDEDLLVHAVAVGLDVNRCLRELAAGVHASRVREDFMTGVRGGVRGTPSLVSATAAASPRPR